MEGKSLRVSSSSFSAPETVKDTDTVKHGKTQKLGWVAAVGFLLASSPILPFHPLLSLFFLSGKEKGWNQGSGSAHLLAMTWAHSYHARLSTCFATGLSRHQIGSCSGTYRTTRVTPQSLGEVSPRTLLNLLLQPPISLHLYEQERPGLGGDRNPQSQSLNTVPLSPAPALPPPLVATPT